MIHFKVTHTAQDHTGMEEQIKTIVNQFELQEHLLKVPGVARVEKWEEVKGVFWFLFISLENKEPFCLTFSNEENLTKYIQSYKKFVFPQKIRYTFERREIKF